LSGAIQDLDRGVILGQRTFGKGLVQTTISLNYNAQLKVTTAKYYIPSGRCIQALDYTHRNEDGSVGHIPDSLISAFKTRNGRTVYDGGGISPDIKIESEEVSQMTISLISQNVIFDYATMFAYQNATIPKVEDFTITDEIYNDFVSFALEQDFDYKTESEKELKELIKIAKREKYYQRAEKEIEALQSKLKNDKARDLNAFKPEIIQFLRDEIVGRYYYQEGQIKTNLKDDNQLDQAIEILKNPERYQAILSGENKKNK